MYLWKKISGRKLGLILILCAVLIVTIGGSIAKADTVIISLYSGSQTRYCVHYCLDDPDYWYYQDNYMYRNASSTQVSIYSTYYHDGDADPSVYFAGLRIYDEENENNVYYPNFYKTYIDDCDDLEYTNWYHDQLDEENNHITIHQYIYYGIGTIKAAEPAFTCLYTGIGEY